MTCLTVMAIPALQRSGKEAEAEAVAEATVSVLVLEGSEMLRGLIRFYLFV